MMDAWPDRATATVDDLVTTLWQWMRNPDLAFRTREQGLTALLFVGARRETAEAAVERVFGARTEAGR